MQRSLVVISAVWCTSCLITKKNIKKIRMKYPDLIIKELDYDFDDIRQYNVGTILPVMIALDGNDEITRLIGEKDYDEVEEFLKECELV